MDPDLDPEHGFLPKNFKIFTAPNQNKHAYQVGMQKENEQAQQVFQEKNVRTHQVSSTTIDREMSLT